MKWWKLLYALPLLAVLCLATFVYAETRPVKPVEPTQTVVTPEPIKLPPPTPTELLGLVNAERAKVGVGPLTLDERLNRSAQEKCDDMLARNYWSHNTPDGAEPWVFIQKYVPVYAKAAENLARNYSSSTETVQGWVISPSHYESMVDPELGVTGFGVCAQPPHAGIKDPAALMYKQYHVVEHFIRL